MSHGWIIINDRYPFVSTLSPDAGTNSRLELCDSVSDTS